jgi:nucleoside diphosphate kinase
MIFAKTVSILLAGVLAVAALRRLMGAIEAAKAQVQPVRNPQPLTRLRQDPRTGVYYPET